MLTKDASNRLAATRMTMARFHVVAIALGLLLAVSEPSFAAKRMSDTKRAVTSQSRAAEPGVSTIRPYSRDDPYAPGVNWPANGSSGDTSFDQRSPSSTHCGAPLRPLAEGSRRRW